jgi:FkbH-like protein
VTGAELLRLGARFQGGAPLRFALASSANLAPLGPFLRGQAARRGRAAEVSLLPFGTLQQALRAPAPEQPEVFLLTPWDFAGELDWRSGVPAHPPDAAESQAAGVAELLRARPRAALFFLAAPVPPLFPDPARDAALATAVASAALGAGAQLLGPDCFSLTSYLDAGFPLASRASAEVAGLIVEAALRVTGAGPEPAKVLVTDLDNVLWQGVVAEDGAAGVAYRPEGPGFRSFLYQTLLRRLKNQGVLLAAVSRNDAEDARGPFRRGDMVVGEEDLVALVASYEPKSAQIESLAAALGLGLEAVVFVDDNPVELAEVAGKLPRVRCLAFPSDEAGLPAFLHELAGHFAATAVTGEDRRRTELYRQRLAGLAPTSATGADLTAFLRSLEMRLVVRERSRGDRARAVQLINKTNQFNLNGRRWDDGEVEAVLAAGGRLLTGELDDRTGNHGEVLACLIDREGVVQSLVMSCRVLQRRVEHAFLRAIDGVRALQYTATDRNEPLRRFLDEVGLRPGPGGLIPFDPTLLPDPEIVVRNG